MGLYDKYARLAGERLQFSDNGLTPFGTCIDEVYSATEGRIGNKKVILAGTNNYLGLTFNHDAISEGQAALWPKAPAPPVLVWQTAVMRCTWR